jgi:hypothetical protein
MARLGEEEAVEGRRNRSCMVGPMVLTAPPGNRIVTPVASTVMTSASVHWPEERRPSTRWPNRYVRPEGAGSWGWTSGKAIGVVLSRRGSGGDTGRGHATGDTPPEEAACRWGTGGGDGVRRGPVEKGALEGTGNRWGDG